MKRTLRMITICLVSVLIGLVITKAVTASAEADEIIQQADAFIETYEEAETCEPETVSLSYSEWQAQQSEPDYSQMDVWTLGSYLYGISELDTTRTLKLISYEGYGYSPLSYYVACCCWVRATEGYWGYSDLFSAFGEADTNYGEWMDCIEIADYAYEYLRLCYLEPSYVKYCNGMCIPEAWVYEEDGIYVW